MPCSCCARDEPPPVPIAPMRVILRWKRDGKVRSIDGEIVFVDADLEIPMWSRMVYRTELFGRTCIRRRRRWVLRLHRRPARRGCDVGDWSARIGADAEGGRGEILKKAPRVVKRGERAGVSGAHRLEARHRPRRHVAQFVSRRRSDALDRQTWISEGQARCALAPAVPRRTAFLNVRRLDLGPSRLEFPAAFAVASSAGLPRALASQTRARPGSAARHRTSTREVGDNIGASTRRVRGETRRARCRQGRREPRATEG
jgi:hypothetical protein